jgi:chromosome segregation ATPase
MTDQYIQQQFERIESRLSQLHNSIELVLFQGRQILATLADASGKVAKISTSIDALVTALNAHTTAAPATQAAIDQINTDLDAVVTKVDAAVTAAGTVPPPA